jgi:hypothetical protein
MGTLKDLVDEAKRRTLLWAILVVCLAYFMSCKASLFSPSCGSFCSVPLVGGSFSSVLLCVGSFLFRTLVGEDSRRSNPSLN